MGRMATPPITFGGESALNLLWYACRRERTRLRVSQNQTDGE
jgi:hypothetical protein